MLAKWQGAAVVVSHDRELLRTIDTIAELSQGALTLYGGNWDFYHARKDQEREGAARDLEVAQRDLKQVRLKAQEAAERQAKSDARGRKSRADAGMSKLLLDAREDRAQKTGGRGDVLAERNADRAQNQLREAEAKAERVKPMRFDIHPPGVWFWKCRTFLAGRYGNTRSFMISRSRLSDRSVSSFVAQMVQAKPRCYV